LTILLQAFFEEVSIGCHIFVVGIRAREGMTLVIEEDIERLCISTELASLEVAPTVADGSQRDVLTVFLYRNFLW
jgi:hypothetical protein